MGSWLIRDLLKKGHRIHCLSRSVRCSHSNGSRHIQHDLSTGLDYDRLPSRLDGIIHCAGRMEKGGRHVDVFSANALSTLNLLEYGKVAGIKTFVLISSGAIYGYGATPFSELSLANPMDVYGESKYCAERLARYYHQAFPLVVILRLFFHYGPGQRRGLIPRLIDRIKNREPIVIYNEGAPKINPIYIGDAVNAIYQSLLLEGTHTFNVCGNEIVSIEELSRIIGDHLGVKPVFAFEKNDDLSDLVGDNTFMKEVLGITPLVSLKEGIKNMLQS